MRRLVTRRSAVIALAAVAAGVTASAIAVASSSGTEPQAFARAGSAADRLPPAAAEFLAPGASRRIASFAAAGGSARAVFLNRSKDQSQICVWDTDVASGSQSGGCNPAGNFFGGHAFTLSLSYDGGPGLDTVRDARIVGVVTRGVASLEVVYADGSTRAVPITRDGGFAHAVPPELLARRVGPVAVVARNAAGKVLDRQATGIG
jgi:hypothetical protein